MLSRAMRCFFAQSYSNKELVIVYESDDPLTIALLKDPAINCHPHILLLEVNASPKVSLGNLRNLGIEASNGEFICQWDDDDWYHCHRLSSMYAYASRDQAEGSILMNWLIYDRVEKKAYVSNYRTWEGSLLCRKSTLQVQPYEDIALGEEGVVIRYLIASELLCKMDDSFYLYIYVYHGGNTWDRDHWEEIFGRSTALRTDISTGIADILDEKVSVLEGSLLLDRLIASAADAQLINSTSLS